MKLTIVNLKAPETCADFPSLTPELLGSVGGRYSRSNEGLDAILERIKDMPEQKAIDSILRYVDYGHQSLADMVPVAIFIDGISMLAAFTLFNRCQVAGGQESSSRYIRFDSSGVLHNEDTDSIHGYDSHVGARFARYATACEFWERHAVENPGLLRLPADAKPAVVDRLKRNYVFDRARYFLPITALTNVMMVQSAREWAKVARYLSSHFLAEYRALGAAIHEKLLLVAPNVARHATYSEQMKQFILAEENQLSVVRGTPNLIMGIDSDSARGWVDMQDVPWYGSYTFEHRDNRYGPIGMTVAAHPVRFGVLDAAIAEIRDLTRHRTGIRYMETCPTGFYSAMEQAVTDTEAMVDAAVAEFGLVELARMYSGPKRHLLASLGFTYNWYHTTTLGHLIYEIELRTGPGAHYRYAQHLHDVADALYLKGIRVGDIIEGNAEPE